MVTITKLRVALLLSAPAAWILFDRAGIVADVPGTNYQRFFYHALPVALSVLYRNWPYDHTADDAMRSLIWSQELGQSLNQTIANSIDVSSALPNQQIPYFWMVDDRGLADFTIAAFWLFGSNMLSLSALWFVILAGSVLLFVISVGKSNVALLVGNAWLWSLALSGAIFVSPTDAADDNFEWFILHLTESRFFTLLAILPVMGMVILAWKIKSLTYQTAFVATFQLSLIGYLTTVRSTVNILGVFVIIAIVGIVFWRSFARDEKIKPTSYSLAFLIVAPITLIFVIPPTANHFIENPRYSEVGERTFWHNALMSYSYSPLLQVDLPMTASDHDAISLVLAFKDHGSLKDASKEIKANPDSYRARAQQGLNWTSTAWEFDWPRYETDARQVYFEVWKTYPHQTLKMFFVDKPSATWKFISNKVFDVKLKTGLFIPYTFLVFMAFMIGLIGNLHLSMSAALKGFALLAALAGVSLIPSFLFYLGSTQVGETYILIGATSSFVSFVVGSWCRKWVAIIEK